MKNQHEPHLLCEIKRWEGGQLAFDRKIIIATLVHRRGGKEGLGFGFSAVGGKTSLQSKKTVYFIGYHCRASGLHPHDAYLRYLIPSCRSNLIFISMRQTYVWPQQYANPNNRGLGVVTWKLQVSIRKLWRTPTCTGYHSYQIFYQVAPYRVLLPKFFFKVNGTDMHVTYRHTKTGRGACAWVCMYDANNVNIIAQSIQPQVTNVMM